MTKPPVARKLAVRHLLLVVSSFNCFKMHAWSSSLLLLLHSTFMLSVVKLLLKGEVGVFALNSHRNYIIDHGKCVFEFLWEPCRRDYQQTSNIIASRQRVNKSGSRAEISCALSRVMVSLLFCLFLGVFFFQKNTTKAPEKPLVSFRVKMDPLFWFGLLLYIPVNSYGHVRMVSSPNHIFFLGKLGQV